MIMIIWTIMKNCRNFIRHFKFQIKNIMHCASAFPCNNDNDHRHFDNFYLQNFSEFLFHKYNIILHLRVILILFLLTVTFFLFKINYIFSYSFKESQNLFIQYVFSYGIKYVYLLYDQIPKLLTLNICKEYVHLFLLLKNFLDYFLIYLFFFN